MGKLINGTKDAGIVVTYDHGYFITKDDFSRMLSAANISNSQNLKLGLLGHQLVEGGIEPLDGPQCFACIIAPRRQGKNNYYGLTETGEELARVVKTVLS